MATNIPAAFRQLRSNLEITSLQQSTVSARQQDVRRSVARRMDVLDDFLTGSYRRHTMVAPLSEADIDIFVVLDAKYYSPGGYRAVLDQLRQALLATYRTSAISRNGQAVTIRFSDFVVDVVPAFYRNGGGYLIPSTSEQRWIPTNPKVHETYLSAANGMHNGNLVPLIKMIKGWNRGIGLAFRSFYLELLVDKALKNVRISDDWSGCRYVFDKGRELIRYKIQDPAFVSDNQVNGLDRCPSVVKAVEHFTMAYKRAVQAEQFANRGANREAIDQWRRVFGGYFPAYG